MSQDRPAAIEVLRTVREFVDSMRTKLSGEDQYHAIVAAYLLGIVERELSLAPGFDRQEQIELARFIAAPVNSTAPLPNCIKRYAKEFVPAATTIDSMN